MLQMLLESRTTLRLEVSMRNGLSSEPDRDQDVSGVSHVKRPPLLPKFYSW
jgi:hypothetical protein